MMTTRERKKQVPFSMAIGNVELVHESFPKHLRMGKVRKQYNKDTQEEGKQKRVNMGRSKAGTKERSDKSLTIVLAYLPTRSLLPEAVDELLDLTQLYTYNSPTAYCAVAARHTLQACYQPFPESLRIVTRSDSGNGYSKLGSDHSELLYRVLRHSVT